MIPIRAHHGMCFAFFHGKGYSTGFTAHMAQVQKLLEENPQVVLRDRADEVCSACPNLISGSCLELDRVRGYDDAVLRLCGLAPGDVLPWKEFQQLVRRSVLDAGKREEICGDCQWSSLCK